MTEAELNELRDLLWAIVDATRDEALTVEFKCVENFVEGVVEGVVERVKRGDQ